eukprot:jgi/Antlo1/1138/840
MADQLRNMPKATRIGGKGSIRRKIKSSKLEQAPPNIGIALKSFKRQISNVGDVEGFTLDYEDEIQVFLKPELKVIMADKKTPVAYVVTGKSRMVNIKKQVTDEKCDDVNKSIVKQDDIPNKEAPFEDHREVAAEHEVPEIEDID